MRCFLLPIMLTCLAGPAAGFEGPVAAADDPLELANRAIRCVWQMDEGRMGPLAVTNLHTKQVLRLTNGLLPRVVLDDQRTIDLADLEPIGPARLETLQADPAGAREETHHAGRRLTATFRDETAGLDLIWSAELRDGANYIVQSLELTAAKDTKIKELVFIDTPIDGAKQLGRVDGSVVVCGDIFLAVEHPLAKNTVDKDSHVRCALPRGNVLGAGTTWRYTSVFGVVEPGQLRRGFLGYLEQRRAHPYRPFLHYNSWYHLNIGRPNNHMTEAECLETIEHFGRELITRRGAKMDAFVWDDGWDDFNSLWGFHEDFPDGFKNLAKAGAKYDVAQGVWMSPWGGYGGPKQKRVAYGKSQGYETNSSGFSMAGPKYRTAFRDVCLKMMRDNGVVFFKFDGMGGSGPGAASDVDAVLNLTRELRKENPDLFISATVGTWASPFWTLYADSIWRQGGDTGFHGPGNGRQQWITYRDMFCYRCVVGWGPLYPLNSLMLHGPCIGDRTNPAKMDRDEKSVADEIWTFFGSGTNLQELYISPKLLTPTMWDELAAAARWSRANTDVLVDTHWIGGDPGTGDVYGWASWHPRGGIVVLRNPSEKPCTYDLELARALELPDPHLTDYQLKSPRPSQRIDSLRAAAIKPLRIELQPFEVLVFEATAVSDAATYDGKAYRQRRAAEEAARKAARAAAAKAAFSGGSVWEYTYQGQTWQRHFMPDGKAHLYAGGARLGVWNGFTWRIEDDRLIVDKPDGTSEGHHLDDQGRLVLPAGLGTARKVQ
ncbi:MAG: enterotoxin [Planctomycetes bacterium]|nr:enterotoxin [Planctomycetota bacterium]